MKAAFADMKGKQKTELMIFLPSRGHLCEKYKVLGAPIIFLEFGFVVSFSLRKNHTILLACQRTTDQEASKIFTKCCRLIGLHIQSGNSVDNASW